MARRSHRLCGADVLRAAAGALVLLAAGCRQDMHDQPKYQRLEASSFFADGRASRPRIPGTVARGRRDDDVLLVTGKADGKLAEVFPAPVTKAVLERGHQRFDVYCSPCHDRMGTGGGIIVQRGFRKPKSFHIERLRNSPPAYVFDVITNGFGAMYDYAAQIRPDDRWAIAAYVKALQLSQNAGIADVPPERRGELDRTARFEEMLMQPSRGGGLRPPSEGGVGFTDDPHDPERSH